MFKRAAVLVAGVVIGAVAVAGVAAATGSDDKTELGAPEGVAPVLAQAPNARLAALIDGGSTVGSLTVVRQVGVAEVTNPATGVFCVRAAASTGIKPAKVVPIVSTEYTLTTGFDTATQWASGRTSCPSGTVEVRTFDTSTSDAVNGAAFTIVIP